MCGIVGYLGGREAAPIILDGLRKLEYRGYDSAGICTMADGGARVARSEGRLASLEAVLALAPLPGTVGIGHTRWATHGRPSEANAHPHKAGPVVVVHNGIIENYLQLKQRLRGEGHNFLSETDSEVIAHLIESKLSAGFEAAVRAALAELRGAYALCILCEARPGLMIAARNGSPLVVGLGDGEFHVASDVPALLGQTRTVVFPGDGELSLFSQDGVKFSTLDGAPVEHVPRHVDWSPHVAEKGGFRHFMLKEIYEQPRAVRDTLAGCVLEEAGDVWLPDLRLTDDELAAVTRICIVACGTSWHASLVGKFLIERTSRVPVEVDIASEFRYREPVVDGSTLTLLVSQSGETADTLAALREARSRGARSVALCNVVDSSIAREADGVIYTHAGPEIGVASTKAFTTQLVALHLFAIRLARARDAMDVAEGRRHLSALLGASSLIEQVLALDPQVEAVARRFAGARDFLYLGRGPAYPIALEGALKLKEVSYIHAEGYPAGEMKHGPIALIDEQMPVLVLAPACHTYDKVASNTEEVRARGGRVVAVCTAGDTDVRDKAEAVLEIPASAPELVPLLLTVPLQLLAYHIAVLRGADVDQPRNLAKSVTVE